MGDNLIESIQKLLQDILTPELREIKSEMRALRAEMDLRFAEQKREMDLRFGELKREIDLRFTAVDQRFAALDQRFAAIDYRFNSVDNQLAGFSENDDLRHKTIMASIGQATAQAELANATP